MYSVKYEKRKIIFIRKIHIHDFPLIFFFLKFCFETIGKIQREYREGNPLYVKGIRFI